MRKRIWMIVVAMGVLTSVALAGTGKLQFVETDVVLYPNGQASVKYTVRYKVLSGEFHGFYFGGLDRLKAYFDTASAFGIDSSGKTYKLDIKNLGDKYDIILANGQGVRSGEVTYKFKFETSMMEAGYLAHTRSPDGKDLIVFNWAPTEWDEALDHYTVKVIYPWDYTNPAADRESVLQKFEELTFRTETWMNEQYRIDYRVEDVAGKRWMVVLLHKENPGSNYKFRIQQYIDAKVFPGISADWIVEEPPGGSNLQTAPVSPQTSAPQKPAWSGRVDPRIALGFGLVIIFIVGVFIVSRKHKSILKAQAGLDDVRWIREDWQAPKIELATFRVPGKVCKDLDPIEAAILNAISEESTS